MMEGVDRVKEIVNDLCQFFFMQVFEKVLFDLCYVVYIVLYWIMKEIKFMVDIQDVLLDLFNVYGYVGQIYQVVVNFIENVIDVMVDSSVRQLCLSVEVSEEGVVLVVFDIGLGVSDYDVV